MKISELPTSLWAWVLLTTVAVAAEKWAWPEQQQKQHKIDGKVKFQDEPPPNTRNHNSNDIANDEVDEVPVISQGVNQSSGGSAGPGRLRAEKYLLNPDQNLPGGSFRNTQDFNDGTLDTVRACRCLHTQSCLAPDIVTPVLPRIQNVKITSTRVTYHRNCFSKFFYPKRSTGQKRGRPVSTEIADGMDHVFGYLENNLDDCQFSIDEIRAAVKVPLPENRTLKRKILERYGDDIIICDEPGKSSVFCFLNIGRKIVQESWYNEKKSNEGDERLRIVQTAANIILEDIRSKIYETEVYPAPEQFLDNVITDVPDSLDTFLSTLILKNKTNPTDVKRKCTSIAHAIISAVRPRSFKSTLLISIGSFLHQKFGSKLLIHLLASLGFSAPYAEIMKLEVSTIVHPQSETKAEFTQFVFDNADINIRTIDGYNTFHAMGGVMCHTQASSNQNKEIVRLPKIPTATVTGQYGNIPIHSFKKSSEGLKKHVIMDVYPDQRILPTHTDFLWLFGKSEAFPSLSGWSSFMQNVSKSEKYEVSQIVPMPFINAPASDYDTIYTALTKATEKCETLKCEPPVVTFDQPLYQKAQEIVASSSDTKMKSIVLRLGGFHLLMSFLGCIGYIMAGSGLKELWSQIYASASIEGMLNGHSYARSIRAHTLTHLALFKIIIKFMNISMEERLNMEEILFSCTDGHFPNFIEEDTFNNILDNFENVLLNLEKNGATAKLWVLYFKMVTLAKNFIAAERSGNWSLHLKTIKSMLPFFHAAGHFSYAKSATLYLQDMDKLQHKMTPEMYKKWEEGGFTIRRTRKFWSGTWTDMIIEQTLMRSMKCVGGLTHGRGVSDSVLSKWILSMPTLQSITQGIEKFCKVFSYSSEQHVDASESRIKRDNNDVEKLDNWFSEHNPFPILDNIMSLSTGLIGSKIINCHEADTIGRNIMTTKTGQNFADVSYSRKDRVLSLAAITSSVEVEGTKIPIEPDVIFRRICVAKKTNEELNEYFSYELSPYPLALFDQNCMRKTKKSVLYELYSPLNEESIVKGNRAYVVDGGFLLHKVLWQKSLTFSKICDRYINFLEHNYKENITVIFDGYGDTNTSTKNAERLRRYKGRTYADVNFNEHMPVTVSQEIFLSNEKNKNKLISLLVMKMSERGISAKQCKDDADLDIVKAAIEKACTHDSVVIIGDDVDLLVILTGTCSNTNIYMEKSGRGKAETKVYSIESSNMPRDQILFVHAISGCDTTSALFRQGKKKVAALLKRTELQQIVKVFNDSNANPDDIREAGEIFLCRLYGDSKGKRLNDLRFKLFNQSLTKPKFNLACLPPTAEAAKQHSYRVYHQIQKWLNVEKSPLEWGWKASDIGLIPIQTVIEPAPKEVLNMISCKCKALCSRNCTCKRSGINCSPLCINCDGKTCYGIVLEEDDDDGEHDIFHTLTDIHDTEPESDEEIVVRTKSKLSFDETDENDQLCTPKRKKTSNQIASCSKDV